MSLSRASISRWASIAFAAVGLSGCFQPLYGSSSGTDIGREMAAITVTPAPDRAGYYLSKELTFALNGGGESPGQKYRLTVNVHERVTTPLIDTVSGRASAAILAIDVDYKLVSTINSDVVASGTAFTTESYDRSSQRFANIRAARDAEIRGAKVISDQIRTRIAAALKTRG